MKTVVALAVLGLVAAWANPARADEQAAQDDPWAEMEKCDICKTMAENKELMQNTTWESHKIDAGALFVMTVPKEMKKDFDACCEKMEAAIQKAESGEKMELCGFCQSMGKLMQAGAKMEEVKTARGMIQLITSQDPAVVKMIHEHVDMAIEAQKQFEQATKTALR